MKFSLAFALLCIPLSLSAATYHVATNGSDAADGSVGTPWLTVQHAVDTVSAGDTIQLGQGNYDEAVTTEDASAGSAGSRIVLDGLNQAKLFRLSCRQPYWTIQNLSFGEINTDPGFSALLSLLLGAHVTIVTNCTFDGTGTIYSSAISMSTGSGTFDATAPSGCLVISNTFTGTKGQAVWVIGGTTNTFTRNRSVDHTVVDFVRIWGQNHVISDNVFSNNMSAPTNETIGFHADFVQTFGVNGQGSRGHVFERNLIVDSASQIGQLVEGTPAAPALIGAGALGSWTFRNNIFARISLGMSQSIPTNRWFNNVFYRCGGTPISAANSDRGSSHGCVVLNNVFLECGDDPTRDNVGWYGVNTNYFSTDYNYNYVAGTPDFEAKREECPIGTPFRWCETNGINGGDPLFVDAPNLNFRLLTNSSLAGVGTNLSAFFTNDFGGSTRTTWDIGSFWFDPGYTPPPPEDPPPNPEPPPLQPRTLRVKNANVGTIRIVTP